jgi:hypothetical protein
MAVCVRPSCSLGLSDRSDPLWTRHLDQHTLLPLIVPWCRCRCSWLAIVRHASVRHRAVCPRPGRPEPANHSAAAETPNPWPAERRARVRFAGQTSTAPRPPRLEPAVGDAQAVRVPPEPNAHARLTRLGSLRVVGVEQQRADPVAADQQRMIDPAGWDLGAVLTQHQRHLGVAAGGGHHLGRPGEQLARVSEVVQVSGDGSDIGGGQDSGALAAREPGLPPARPARWTSRRRRQQ